ncbi:MAG: four-helix bundle copper-binding protein [Zunongwangia sp.]|mgnify:CR=1 FL=1|jgi:hypothetical protein|uniref:Four-helix bundle copper-binding protein n=1 Tax=Zunongwangia profunda TaxID=398743 RepID=A0A3D5IWL7_9FLAO|nr:four-helix bundle copper-binding protein [Zunongwangia profunda]MAO34896.1 four-helix bundle copper-binding protein [Zunongwangia sp.]MAS70063.1 four-helix bundle copper-binding protein [Zunongwangia sp.]MCC4228992.1 four-helix bundle copper-binding protein [Zunongwangia profunda]HCV79430.1 four-helix bundle copper-binding protein [Zunongwangia profunda]|tara:strand:- start:2432 stop:2752 length:321 start_codon:yes stop_codon:yes gene_type:complete
MKRKNLIQTLYDCAAHCLNCADKCLTEENLSDMINCIRLDRICASTCIAAANALSVDCPKEDVEKLIAYCEEICSKCGEECAQHENEHCFECAKACKNCAEECSKF